MIKTPCIGICSTGIGDNVCRGCKRYAHEVIDWNAYSDQQKAIIEDRLVSLLTLIIRNKFMINNEALMRLQITTQPVDIPTHRNIYCQAYTLIKAGAGQIKSTSEFGFHLSSEVSGQPLANICKDTDAEFYLLSVAYFERSFLKIA